MSFYYIVNAVAYVGDSLNNVNEGFFADNISSFSTGTYENTRAVFKSVGKKHAFCIIDSDVEGKRVSRFFRNLLSSKGQGKVRVKFQYDLKEMMDNIFSPEQTKCASLLYSEGKNVFVSGYNEVFVYKYSSSENSPERITFPPSSETLLTRGEALPGSLSRYVGTLAVGDEYLIFGKQAFETLGEERILELINSKRPDICQDLTQIIDEENPSGNYCIIHLKAKRSIKWLVAVLASVVGVAAICALAFLI